ncbi:uncharacterized protein PSFLO_03931 [Pseudozyma flocculosa]|uniref:Uncharacterized protein n=1 Tax=Pseudozyma flocculosa TaxID=84751 RepID=A0A5C3F1Q7_9BASI|nr:uncharacterized protein PSFLO_03931 [Pseudozyma flocculosa]
MSLRSEARDLEKAVQMSRAAFLSAPDAAAAGKENVVPGAAASTITANLKGGLPPLTGLDSISTPPLALSSPPTTVYASSASFNGAAPQHQRTGLQTPSAPRAASSPLKDMIATSSKPKQYTSSAAKKRSRAARIEDSDEEDGGPGTSSREVSPELLIAKPHAASRSADASRSKQTEVFVELPESTTKRTKADTFDLTSDPPSSPVRRQSTACRNKQPSSSASTTAGRDRKRKQQSTEADDAAFAAALALQGEGVATRRASRNASKAVSYAPVCDKDGRPIKTASSSSAPSSSRKVQPKEAEPVRRSEKTSEDVPAGSAKRKRDRASRIRDDDETDEEDWQSSHSIDSPAGQRTLSGQSSAHTNAATTAVVAEASKRLLHATSATAAAEAASTVAKGTAERGPEGPPAATSSVTVVVQEDAEPGARRSKRQSDKAQKEAEAKAARKKAREERKKREAEEQARLEAEPKEASGSKKDSRKKTKTADSKVFDLSTSPARGGKAKPRGLDRVDVVKEAQTVSDEDEEPSTSAQADERTQAEAEPSPSATAGRACKATAVSSTDPRQAGEEDGPARRSSVRDASTAAVEENHEDDETRDEVAARPASPAATSPKPATPAKAKEPVASVPATLQRAVSHVCAPFHLTVYRILIVCPRALAFHHQSTSAPRPEATPAQTPTVGIAHRSSSTPTSSRPSTPGSSSFMGKSLSTLLTPGSSRYGAVRRPGLARKIKIPSLLNKRGPLPPPRPPAPLKKKKRGDEDDYEYDEAYERLMGRIKDEDASDNGDADDGGAEAEDDAGAGPDEGIDEVVDDY